MSYQPYYSGAGMLRRTVTVSLDSYIPILDRRAKERDIARSDLARRVLEVVLDDPAELDRLLSRWKRTPK